MDGLAVQGVDLELAGRERLIKLVQRILARHRVPVPHQGGLVQVQAGQVLGQKQQTPKGSCVRECACSDRQGESPHGCVSEEAPQLTLLFLSMQS